MKLNKWFTIIVLIIGPIIIEVILIPIRGINLYYSGVIGLFLFGLYTFLGVKMVKILKPRTVILFIVSGTLLIHLPYRIPYWNQTLVTLPDALMHLIGIGLGYFFWHVKIWGKLLIIVPLSVILSIGYCYGFKMFLNKLNHNTWTGKVAPFSLNIPLNLHNSNGDIINLEHFKGSYLLLDFWTTNCGYCIKAFPHVQERYDQFKTSDVNVFAIHCRFEDKGENYNTGETIISKRGFTFPCLSTDVKDTALEAIGIYRFPVVLIFDPNGKIIFRGEINEAGKYLEKTLKYPKSRF